MLRIRPLSDRQLFARWVEMLFLFFGSPMLFVVYGRYARLAGLSEVPKVPLLGVLFVVTTMLLLGDPDFDRRRLWNWAGLRHAWRGTLLRFIPCAAGLLLYAWWYHSPTFLDMPRAHTRFWLMLLILYPLLSVYPQEVVYRVFFEHRYGCLTAHRASRLLLNAAAFSCMHIVYENTIAVALTFLGGLLFAGTYERTESAAAPSLEHALFGCLIFTAGLGAFFS